MAASTLVGIALPVDRRCSCSGKREHIILGLVVVLCLIAVEAKYPRLTRLGVNQLRAINVTNLTSDECFKVWLVVFSFGEVFINSLCATCGPDDTRGTTSFR